MCGLASGEVEIVVAEMAINVGYGLQHYVPEVGLGGECDGKLSLAIQFRSQLVLGFGQPEVLGEGFVVGFPMVHVHGVAIEVAGAVVEGFPVAIAVD